jgi:hypothetical protein
MPARKTHERRGASSGGLDGSDASGWSLEPARDEARCGGGKRREGNRGGRVRRSHNGEAAHYARGRTTSAAKAARIGSDAHARRLVDSAVRAGSLLRSFARVGVLMRRLAMMPRVLMRVTWVSRDGMRPQRRATAQHARGNRAPHGGQKNQQDDEANAKDFHGSNAITGGYSACSALPPWEGQGPQHSPTAQRVTAVVRLTFQ